MGDMTEEEMLAEMNVTDGAPPADPQGEGSKSGDVSVGDTEPNSEADRSESQDEEPAEKPAGDNPAGLRQDDGAKISRRAYKRQQYEISRLRRQIEELRQSQEAQKAVQKPAVSDVEPKRSHFRTDEEYMEALTRVRVAEALAQREASAAEAEAEGKALEAWKTRIRESFPTQEEQEDYDASIASFGADPESVIGVNASDFILSHKEGPKMLVYLADHRNLCERLRNAHPFEQAEILCNIANYVGTKKAASAAALSRKPASPVGSLQVGGTAGTGLKTAEQWFDELSR